MENNFVCPKCNGMLNISDKIVFSTRTKNGKFGMIFLSPKVGDYSIEKNPTYHFSDGEQLDFYCPMCKAMFTAASINKNLAEVLLIDKDNKRYRILFSMVAGEKCTYKITEDKIEKFGDNSSLYMDFINLSLNK